MLYKNICLNRDHSRLYSGLHIAYRFIFEQSRDSLTTTTTTTTLIVNGRAREDLLLCNMISWLRDTLPAQPHDDTRSIPT